MKYNVNLKFVSIRKCTTFSGKEYQPLYRERPYISEQSCKQAQTEIFRPWGAEKPQLHVWKVIVVNRIRFYTLYINIPRTDIFKFAICRGPHWARFLSGRCDDRGQETIWYFASNQQLEVLTSCRWNVQACEEAFTLLSIIAYTRSGDDLKQVLLAFVLTSISTFQYSPHIR